MITSTALGQIEARAIDFHAAEAARNAPVAVARRAVYSLSSALAELGVADRSQVLTLLRDEVLGLPVTA